MSWSHQQSPWLQREMGLSPAPPNIPLSTQGWTFDSHTSGHLVMTLSASQDIGVHTSQLPLSPITSPGTCSPQRNAEVERLEPTLPCRPEETISGAGLASGVSGLEQEAGQDDLQLSII